MTRSSILFAALALLVGPALAQDAAPVYFQVDYMRVAEEREAEYLAVERDLFRPIHEERRRRGGLVNWTVYDVVLAAPDAPYDYVTVNVYSDPAQIDGTSWADVLEAAHPGMSFDDLMARTTAAREIVHTEIWAFIESVQPEGAPGPTGRYLALNYMAVPPGGGAEYVAAEREVWAPVHQARTDDGLMGGWSLYTLVLPRGDAVDYNYGTVDFFDDMGDVLGQITWDMMSEAHGGASRAELEAMADRTEAARSVHKTELWSVVESLDGVPGE